MMMFCSAVPEKLMYAMGKLYEGKSLEIKTRAKLLASIKPNYWKYLREDAGDLPQLPTPTETEPQLATA